MIQIGENKTKRIISGSSDTWSDSSQYGHKRSRVTINKFIPGEF